MKGLVIVSGHVAVNILSERCLVEERKKYAGKLSSQEEPDRVLEKPGFRACLAMKLSVIMGRSLLLQGTSHTKVW